MIRALMVTLFLVTGAASAEGVLDDFRRTPEYAPDAMAATSEGGALLDSKNVGIVKRSSPGVYLYIFEKPLPDDRYAITFMDNSFRRIEGKIRLKEKDGFAVEFSNPFTGEPRDRHHIVVIYTLEALKKPAPRPQ